MQSSLTVTVCDSTKKKPTPGCSFSIRFTRCPLVANGAQTPFGVFTIIPGYRPIICDDVWPWVPFTGFHKTYHFDRCIAYRETNTYIITLVCGANCEAILCPNPQDNSNKLYIYNSRNGFRFSSEPRLEWIKEFSNGVLILAPDRCRCFKHMTK